LLFSNSVCLFHTLGSILQIVMFSVSLLCASVAQQRVRKKADKEVKVIEKLQNTNMENYFKSF